MSLENEVVDCPVYWVAMLWEGSYHHLERGPFVSEGEAEAVCAHLNNFAGYKERYTVATQQIEVVLS